MRLTSQLEKARRRCKEAAEAMSYALWNDMVELGLCKSNIGAHLLHVLSIYLSKAVLSESRGGFAEDQITEMALSHGSHCLWGLG